MRGSDAAVDELAEGALAAAVQAAIPLPVLAIREVVREELPYDPFMAGRSVGRVRGTALTTTGSVSWSFVEKVTAGPAVSPPYLYDNGRREYAAYGSGLLADLAPGLTVPRVLGRDEDPDGALRLWLEELDRPKGGRLADVDVVRAAGALGRLAARWLERVPEMPWMFTGWIDRHAQSPAMRPAQEMFAGLERRAAVEAALGRPIDEAIDLIDMQPSVRTTLDGLPVTLCHHDAVAANVFLRRRDGSRETVLIDWESIGPGPIGADLASLIFSSVRRGDLASGAARRLVDPAVDGYTAALRAGGVAIERPLVRRAFDAAVALRWTLVRDVAAAIDADASVYRGSARHESPAEALEQLLDLTELLFDCAERLAAS